MRRDLKSVGTQGRMRQESGLDGDKPLLTSQLYLGLALVPLPNQNPQQFIKLKIMPGEISQSQTNKCCLIPRI